MATLFARVLGDLSDCWKQLVATDLVYKAIALVLLTPLLGLLFRVLLAASGDTVLTDQEILYFLLGPAGWACALLAGGVWLAIVALEQAALLRILAADRPVGRIAVVAALRFAGRHASPVLTVTIRMVAFTLLTVAPFLAAIGLLYAPLLGEHDINFYLKEKPPEFIAAVALAALVVLTLIVVLLRLFSGWFFALPVVLFEKTPASDALRASKARARGHRWFVLRALVLWLLGSFLISAVSGGAVVGIGRMAVPLFAGNLAWLLLVIGALLLLWAALGLAANLLSTVVFASMLFATYRQAGGEPPDVESWAKDGDAPAAAWTRLTMRRLVVLSLAAAALSVASGVQLLRTVRIDDEVVVIAHRGASARAPENTLASIRLAIDEGADWVEIDVQEIADREVAVFHDSDFMKLAGDPLKIWDATAADLKALDIGSSFAPEFREERTPLLGDVLDLCKGRVKVLIELKYYGHDEQLERRVLDLVAEREMESQVKYMSLKLPAITKLKSLAPQAEAGVLMSVAAGDVTTVPAEFIAINARFADRRTVRQAHKNDRLVYVWTVNDALTMSRMIGRGVDGLITDDPALARSVVSRRSQLSPGERLLLELADLFGIEQKVSDQ